MGHVKETVSAAVLGLSQQMPASLLKAADLILGLTPWMTSSIRKNINPPSEYPFGNIRVDILLCSLSVHCFQVLSNSTRNKIRLELIKTTCSHKPALLRLGQRAGWAVFEIL